jgi:transposase-like protein
VGKGVTTTIHDMTNVDSANSPESGPKKRRFLSAEKKFQIYLEAQSTEKPVGELLRREGLFSTDLARIRQQVREGALVRLRAKPGRKAETVASSEFKALKQELLDKKRALADMAVEMSLLRKKNQWGFVGTIATQRLKAETKQEILAAIDFSLQSGVSVQRSCSILMIQYRRIARWQQRIRRGRGLEDRRPGPQRPFEASFPAQHLKAIP